MKRSTCAVCGKGVAPSWLSRHFALTGHSFVRVSDVKPTGCTFCRGLGCDECLTPGPRATRPM